MNNTHIYVPYLKRKRLKEALMQLGISAVAVS